MSGINIRDVAKHCNISVSTVSRVLNERPDVNPKTRQRVLDAISQLDYIPNNSARNLVMTASDRIAVVVRGLANPFFGQMIRTIEEDVYRAGFTMELRHISSDADEVHTAAVLATEKRLCGVLLLGGRFNYTADEMRVLDVPYVCTTYTNTFGNMPQDAFSSVAIDDRAEACRAVEHLIGLGHRKIAAIVSSEKDRSISELRYQGYCEALEKHGISYEPSLVVESGQYSQRSAVDAANRLLARNVEFTAVFTISDMMALAVMKALHERGVWVPEDCSVIGIDGLESSLYSIPTLTTVVQPAEEMATESTAILIDLVRGQGKNRHTFFPAHIREGGSARRIDAE